MLRGMNMKEKILIENGTIIDGTGSKEYIGNIVIEDNKIIATGESAKDFSKEKDIKKIDASEKFVMPGIIDAHCHISFDEPTSNDELFFHRRQALAAIISGHNARKVLLAGVTGFCDPDSLHEIGIDLRDAINSGYVEGPRMSVGGNALLTSVGGTAGRLIPDEGIRGYAQIVHNKDEIKRLGLVIGDTVSLKRAGDVIPQIVNYNPKLRPIKYKNIIFQENCPSCNTPLKYEEDDTIIRCFNHSHCKEQIIGQLIHFVSRNAFNIDGLGEKQVIEVFNTNLVK